MSVWKEIYNNNQQINKYPFESVVKFIFKNYGKLTKEDRKKIKVLEVGCGTGNNIWFLAEEGFDVYGIDISPKAIELSKNMLTKKGLSASLYVSSFTELPFENNYFDIIIDRLAIINCPEFIDESLCNVYNKLNVNGKFFCVCFNTNHDGYKRSVNKYTKINEFGLNKVDDLVLSECGPIYFMDENYTILKKYFKIIEEIKVTYEENNNNNCQSQLVLIKI
jgi:ubiquinone/menaquinone biosynthesis C-methylase UbiE